jgi:hypothetical protein
VFEIAGAAYLNWQNGLLTKEIWDQEGGAHFLTPLKRRPPSLGDL